MLKPQLRALSGAALAAGLMLAGCNLSPQQVQDLAKTALSIAQTDTGKAIASQLVANLQQYTDIDAGQTLADTAAGLNFDGISFTAQSVNLPLGKNLAEALKDIKAAAPALAKANTKAFQDVRIPQGKIDADKKKVEQALKGRIDPAKFSDAGKKAEYAKNMVEQAKPKLDAMRKAVAKRVDARIKNIKEKFDPSKDFESSQGTASIDPWGDVTIVSATMSLKVKEATKTHVFDRYYDDNKVLVWVIDHTVHAFKNGAKHVADRDRMNFDDGTYKITYTASTTGPKGKTRSVSWNRDGKADGSESGSGTITRFDGATTNVTFTKDAEGKTVTSTTDDSTKTKVEVSQTEGSSEAVVVTVDSQDPTKTASETINSEDLEPDDTK